MNKINNDIIFGGLIIKANKTDQMTICFYEIISLSSKRLISVLFESI